MTYHAISTQEKPFLKLSMADWYSRVGCLRNVASARCADAIGLRYSSHKLRHETRIERRWSNYETNTALDDRILEMSSWRELISKASERLENEVHLLQGVKTAAEQEMERESGQIALIKEMLSLRDKRFASELTYDKTGLEIKNELVLLKNNRRVLSELLQKAWEKLKHLEEVRFKVDQEVKNKLETIEIDSAQRSLERNSSQISYKPEGTHNSRDFCAYSFWLEHTQNIMKAVEGELVDAAALRETLHLCTLKARRFLDGQEERTDAYTRLRVFQTQQLTNELEWQQMRLREEIKSAMYEIQTLENDVCDMANDIRLAETRLENRSQRCKTELCLDNAHYLLSREVEKQREIRRCLENKLDESKFNLQMLSEHAKKISYDLDKKQQTLINDKQMLVERQHFKNGEAGLKLPSVSPQTDRNIVLTRTENITQKD
ncbi:tektin-2-like [Drosophila montana]|uniref:tektin-2-like n=1 Tax=Drosophila montana TaxID=40370 RepID=UPI00313CFF2E